MSSKNYRKHDIRRQCDCCGAIWFMSQLRYVGQNRWFCPDDAPGLTAEQISRHNANVRPLIIKQAKHPRPQTQNSTYLLSEAACFRAVMDFAGIAEYVDQNGGVVLAAQYVATMANAGLYLSDLIRDGERTKWLYQAKTKMAVLAEQILALQYGSASGPSPSEATSSMLYGAIFDTTGISYSLDVELAGKLFLRMYADVGDQKWLAAADRCAMWLRSMQRLDAGATFFSLGRLRIGGFGYGLQLSPRRLSGVYAQADMGLSFLADLKTVRGGSYTYGLATAAGDFLLATLGTIDEMIADAAAFYFDGAFQVTPLISTTPKAFYSAVMADGSGSGTFQNFPNSDGSQYVIAWEMITGIRSLFDLEGYTSRVAALVTYLLSFTGGDATFAPAQYLLVKDALGNDVSVDDGTIYDLMAAGLLAPALAARGVSLRALKDTIESKHVMTADSTDALGGKNGVMQPFSSVYPAPTGQLSFDGTAPMSTIWVESAAVVAGVYRLQPRAIDNQPTN